MTPDSVILRCKQCGAKNRGPKQRMNDRPICGKCRAPLPPDPIFDQPVVVTDQTFQQEVLDFSGPVLLDCWAPWCGPCQMVAPLLIQLAKESNLKIMLGCMIESSLAISAAAQLAPLADWLDLDGNLLIENDPFIGTRVKRGQLIYNNQPGIGASEIF